MKKEIKTKNNKKTNIVKKTTVKKTNTSKTIKKKSLIDNKDYKLAEKLYKNKEYEKAYESYYRLHSIFPKNKKIYKRLLECLTRDYTYKESSREFKTAIDDYITTYKILCTKKELKYFENNLDEYKHVKTSNSKSRFLLIAFLGYFGIHKFLEKKYILGILYLFTLGFFGIGVLIDLINDYAEYENDFHLNILRYLISLIIILFGIFMFNKTANFYYFIIIGIILLPIIYSKILRLIPNLIKIISIIFLAYFGFKVEPIIEYVPTNILGKWTTNNESTNYKELNIKLDKTTITFTDRDSVTGVNTYNKDAKILSIKVNEQTTYKFRIDFENNKICSYTESKKCLISFEK